MKIKPLIPKTDFPIFRSHPSLVYLDNAATQQLHKSTIDTVSNYYQTTNANSSRGLYDLTTETEKIISTVRDQVRTFLKISPNDDIVFTKNTTESLNIISTALLPLTTSDDEIIVFTSGHHSNLLPWMELSKRTGARLITLDYDFDNPSDIEDFATFLTSNVRLIALSGMSNVTGFQPNLKEIIRVIRNSPASHALVSIDAAQLVAHNPENLHDIDYDIIAFSGHKLGSPTGLGVLCLKTGLLMHLSPVFVGGGTVEYVHADDLRNGRVNIKAKYHNTPARFEAGTINTGGIVGLGKALDLMTKYPLDHRQAYEAQLLDYLLKKADNLPHLSIYFAENGIFTFNLDGVHPHDVAQLLSSDGICVRAGYHCAQPLHELNGLGPTVRASLAWYNDQTDIDRFVALLKTVRERMGLPSNNERNKNAKK